MWASCNTTTAIGCGSKLAASVSQRSRNTLSMQTKQVLGVGEDSASGDRDQVNQKLGFVIHKDNVGWSVESLDCGILL